MRPPLEVADIFRQHGDEFRLTHTLSPEQRRVMRAVEQCRTASLGGHVEQCDSKSDQPHGDLDEQESSCPNGADCARSFIGVQPAKR
jgi:hypothetical protein